MPRRGVSRIPMPVDHSQSVYAALKACEKSVLHKRCMKNVRHFLAKGDPKIWQRGQQKLQVLNERRSEPAEERWLCIEHVFVSSSSSSTQGYACQFLKALKYTCSHGSVQSSG